jgi:phosphohistidine phosphatase
MISYGPRRSPVESGKATQEYRRRLDFSAMDLWLLRHAKAQAAAASGRDDERALTAKGTLRAAAVARGLAILAPTIEVVLSSPYRRARETAEAAARALGVEGVIESSALEPGQGASEVVRQLSASPWNRVLLVGHEPLLGSVVGLVVFGDDARGVPLRKAELARLSWNPGGAGTLEALIPAEILEKLTADRG